MWTYGLFGQIGKGAVIRNITFDKTVYSGGTDVSIGLLAWSVQGATIENITINVKAYAKVNSDNNADRIAGLFVEHGIFAARYFIDNVVRNVKVNAQGFELGRVIARVTKGCTFEYCTIYAKSYDYIADDTDSASYNMLEEFPDGLAFIEA